MLISKIQKRSQMPVSIVVLLLGIFLFLYLVFSDYDLNNSNGKNNKGGNNTNKNINIELSNIFLSMEKERYLLLNVPLIVLDYDNNYYEKKFLIDDEYDYLEIYYRVKEINNFLIKVYFDEYLINFDEIGDSFFKQIEKPLFKNKKEATIKIEGEPKGFLLINKVFAKIEDLSLFGIKIKNKAELKFNLDNFPKNNLKLIIKMDNCERGTLFYKLNECPSEFIKFNCNGNIEINLKKICLKNNNILNFKLNSGLIQSREVLIKG